MRGRFAIACMALACSYSGILAAAELPDAERTLVPKVGSVIAFLGDGAAHSALFTQYLEDFFLTRYPQDPPRIVNAGVRNARTAHGLQRFSFDVADRQPTHVAVWLGMNADEEALSLRDDVLQAYRHDLAELDRRIRDLGAVPIYLSPTIFDSHAARRNQPELASGLLETANAASAYFSIWLQEFAEQGNAAFVDLHGPLNTLTRLGRRDTPDFTLMQDGFQPAPSGHLVIATAFLEQMGLEKPLSAIRIARQPEGLTATAEGGAVLNLQSPDAQTVSFLWQAEALPWIVPAETAPAGELLNLSDRFNREMLEIQGLAAGMYEVLIDERLIGRYSHEVLAEGLNLDRLTTPQSEQARRIAERNKERTEAALHPALKDWGLVEEQFRLQQQLLQQPNNDELVRKSAALEEQLTGFSERQAKLSHVAEEWLSELREECQPIPRQFTIRPVQIAEVRGRVLIGGMPISGAVVELHGMRGLTATGTTDAMGFFQMAARSPDGIEPGAAWLVVLAKMVLPKFVSLEKNGHRVMLRSGVNEVELHFEEQTPGQ